ncbi:hypothetical protein FRC03_009312 [Tulasnella sp. 419]|nr:hypothetical protein FRC03_009312 [Tulasnella sp. 419]
MENSNQASSRRSSNASSMSDSSATGARGGQIGLISRASPRGSIADSDVSDVSEGGRRYHLEVVQHPERTAEIGSAAVLSRIPLSPPLIVRVTVQDPRGAVISGHTDMPFLAAHLWLYNEDGTEPVDVVDGPPSPGGTNTTQRMLYGTLVSSIHSYKDLQGNPGMFLIFPDVSVRRCGTYRLLVSLMKLATPAGSTVMPVGMDNTTLASVRTRPFNVVSQSEYSAPPPTALTNSFHRQGARM